MKTTIEAAAEARGMSVDDFRTSEFERLRRRHAEAVRRRPATGGTGPVALAERRRAAPKAAPRATPVATPAVVEAELAAAFRRGGMSAESALVAARGRFPREPSSLYEAFRAVGMSDGAARVAARGRDGVREAVVRNVAGLSAACFAWVPDPESPETWQLQIARDDDSGDGAWQPDEDLVRRAVAMVPGIAGFDQALDIPAGDLPTLKATLRAAWIACGAALDEMPFELNQEALRRAFMRGGLSERAAAIAARGRERRI